MIVEHEETLDEFRIKRRCEWCKRPACGRLDAHHVFIKRALDSGSRLDVRCNLMAVHRWACHDEANRNWREAREIVAEREGTTSDVIEEMLWALLRKPKRPKGTPNAFTEEPPF